MTASVPVLKTLTGEAIRPLLPELARLRIAVFRAWPYLYDGDADYEARYLRTYVESDGAAVIVAFASDVPIGASTCLPLRHETANVIAPFRARGWDPDRFCYFGESVLLPEWRGRGLGVGFFASREAHARSLAGIDYACFCGVIRSDDHPARPDGAVPLDGFWRRRGYTPYPDLVCTMAWKDIGSSTESEKTLRFWIKSLSGAALP